MKLLETVANSDFCLFLLGAFGVAFYVKLHGVISKCNPKVFSTICVVLTYIFVAYIHK